MRQYKMKKLLLVLVWVMLLALFASVTFAWADGEPVTQTLTYRSNVLFNSTEETEILVTQQAIITEINDIVGATYDPSTGDLIVIGRTVDDNLPTMDYGYIKQHLLIAMRAVHHEPPSHHPGVTIGTTPSPEPDKYHLVEYFGNITDTHYGYVFFESDRLLKTYTMGRDNFYPTDSITSEVPGYKSYPERLLDLQASHPTAIRWWFTSALHLRVSPITTNTILFSNTQVVLNYEIEGGETPENRQAGQEFVNHFNNNYRSFATEQFNQDNSALHELTQLFKLYGIAYWTWDIDNTALTIAGANPGWLDNYPILIFTTPTTTPVALITDPIGGGQIVGGVAATPPDFSGSSLAGLTGETVQEERNDPNMYIWNSSIAGDPSPTRKNTTTQVVAMAFRLSENLVANHSFEGGPGAGSAPWVQNPYGSWDLIDANASQRGDYGVFLGYYSNVDENIYQDVSIPASATNPRLTYYWAMETEEPMGISETPDHFSSPHPFITTISPEPAPVPSPTKYPSTLSEPTVASAHSIAAANDFLYVQILDTNNNLLETLQIISNEDISGYWHAASFPLNAYKGQTIRIKFRATNDAANHTAFFIDDVSLDIMFHEPDSAPPDLPTLLSLVDGAVISDTTPTLSWQASPSPDAAGYLLDFNDVVTNVGNTFQYTTNVLADGDYTWTVAAYDGLIHTSAFTDVWNFTVDTTPPDPPTLLSSADGAVISDTSLTLSWEASPSPDVAGYLLNFNGTVIDVGNTSQYTTDILDDGVYTWTVAAYDGTGHTSTYTDVWEFVVDTTPPDSPTLLSPADGAIISDTTPTLVWASSSSPDVTGYLLNWNGLVMDVGKVTQHTVFVQTGGVYIWNVAAYDVAGNVSTPNVSASLTIQPNGSGETLIYLPVIRKDTIATSESGG